MKMCMAISLHQNLPVFHSKPATENTFMPMGLQVLQSQLQINTTSAVPSQNLPEVLVTHSLTKISISPSCCRDLTAIKFSTCCNSNWKRRQQQATYPYWC